MTADTAIRIVLLTLQGCKIHTHDHQLPPFACHRSRGDSEDVHHDTSLTNGLFQESTILVAAARESGRINDTDSDNVGDRDATFSRWFRCLTGAPTYLYDATIPSFFFYAHAKWKARTNVTPGRRHRSRY